MKKDLLEIIQRHGLVNQLKYMQTEMCEFITAVSEYEYAKRNGETKNLYLLFENITEEYSDLTMMLDQFVEYYQLDKNKIRMIKGNKAKRELGRLNKSQEEK